MSGQIQFKDGAGYERYMGKWSQLAGRAFLDWLAPASGLRWLDVGCGNGAFTEMLVERTAPSSVDGIDPSDAQLAFARERRYARPVAFHQGDAMALPFSDDAFDAAVMPLVIFFVPDPAAGVAEMARVVRPGGSVSAYGWDLSHGGHPYEALIDEIRKFGVTIPTPPNPDAASVDSLARLWSGAGLSDVETHAIDVERTFASFDDYWTTVRMGASVSGPFSAMSAADLAELEARLQKRLTQDATGRITYGTRANAVKGRVPE